jgi:hypothetical protein
MDFEKVSRIYTPIRFAATLASIPLRGIGGTVRKGLHAQPGSVSSAGFTVGIIKHNDWYYYCRRRTLRSNIYDPIMIREFI